MEKGDPDIVVTKHIHAPLHTVWKAMTDVEQMREWFFNNIPDFKPEKGFKTQFVVQPEERSFTHLWEITDLKPLRYIRYNWKYAEYQGDSFVTFTLTGQNGGTQVEVRHEVTKDFSGNIPELTRKSCQGGWEYFLGELSSYL